MSAGFTPGPWPIDDTGDYKRIVIGKGLVEGPNGYEVAEVYSDDCPREVAEANARLIAAAPELYEALRQCRLELDYCQQQLAARGQTGHPEDSVSRALKAGRAALAKARGEAA